MSSKGTALSQQVKKRGNSLGRYLEEGARISLLIFLGLAATISIAYLLTALSHRYPLDYGEAPLLDQALRLAAGQNIYPPDLSSPPYTPSYYPPLYPLSLIPLVKLFGPSLVLGRIISLLSALAAGTFLALIVHSRSPDRTVAVATALLPWAIPYVLWRSTLTGVELPALALSTAGLYVAVRWPATRRGWVVSALLLVAAICTCQAYLLAGPLAAFVWLLRQDRRQAFTLIALVGGASAALFLILAASTRGGFFFHLVTANYAGFELQALQQDWRTLLEAAPVLLAIGALAPILSPRRTGAWTLLPPYLLGAVVSTAAFGQAGRDGASFVQLYASLSLAAGLLAASLRERPWWRALLLTLLMLQVGPMANATLQGPVESLTSLISPASDLEELEWQVKTAEGPVLADELMGMLSLQNRTLYLDPRQTRRLAEAGLWDPSEVVARIVHHEFPLILIHHSMEEPAYKRLWTPEMLSAIIQHYTPADWLAETVLFRPRSVVDGEIPPASESCPGAPWRLPTRSEMGFWWISGQLLMMGEGHENGVPVYAVADGLLTRRAHWEDAVAIQHDDPLRPGEKVWTYYGDMGSGWDDTSFVSPDFPPGSEDAPVKRGQLLGYQGQRYGAPARIWVHLHFAVVPALEDGSFPEDAVDLTVGGKPWQALDPSPYLGTVRSPVRGTPDWLPPRCQQRLP